MCKDSETARTGRHCARRSACLQSLMAPAQTPVVFPGLSPTLVALCVGDSSGRIANIRKVPTPQTKEAAYRRNVGNGCSLPLCQLRFSKWWCNVDSNDGWRLCSGTLRCDPVLRGWYFPAFWRTVVLLLGRVETVDFSALEHETSKRRETRSQQHCHLPQDVIFSMEWDCVYGSPEYRPLTNLWRDRMGVPAIRVRKRRVSVIFIWDLWLYIAQWSLYVPPGLAFSNSLFCPHSVFMCFVWIWEQTAIISLYSINWLVFITETECVYCGYGLGLYI